MKKYIKICTLIISIITLTACSNSPSDSEVKKAFSDYYVNVASCKYMSIDKFEKINGIKGDDDRHYQISAALTVKLDELPDPEGFKKTLDEYEAKLVQIPIDMDTLKKEADGVSQVDWSKPDAEEKAKLEEQAKDARWAVAESRYTNLRNELLETDQKLKALIAYRKSLISMGCGYLDVNQRNPVALNFLNFDQQNSDAWPVGVKKVTIKQNMYFIKTDNGWVLGN